MIEKEFIDFFEKLDFASPGNTYDWFSLRIDLKLPINEETIHKLNRQDSNYSSEELNALHYFIHEYIHFLQNVTTNWGAPILSDYALSLLKIGASSISHERVFELPINFEVLCTDIGGLLEDGYGLLKTVQDRCTRNEGATIFTEKNTFPEYKILSETSDELLEITNGRIKKVIGLLTIRESMAHVGSFLFLNYSDKEIHEINLSSKHFCSSTRLIDKGSEYWILFEYIIETYPHFSNIAKGIYALCVEALTKLNPEKSVKRFFNWISVNHVKSNDFHELIKLWAISEEEHRFYVASSQATITHLDKLVSLCNKHKADNSIFESFEKLILFAKDNLGLFDGGRSLYFYNVDYVNKGVWYMYLKKIGSPLVRYKKTAPIIYGPTQALDFDLTLLLGLSKSISSIQKSADFVCPFLEEFPICKIKDKPQLCRTQPYLVNNPDKDGLDCLFISCLKLVGFHNRLAY